MEVFVGKSCVVFLLVKRNDSEKTVLLKTRPNMEIGYTIGLDFSL